MQTFEHSNVGFGEAEEGSVTEAREDELLCDQHTSFDFGLVLGVANTGRYDCGAVMIGQFGIGGIDLGFITAGFGHCGKQIVGNEAMRNGSQKSKRAGVRSGPIGERLRPGELGVGLIAVAHDPDKHFSLAYLTG